MYCALVDITKSYIFVTKPFLPEMLCAKKAQLEQLLGDTDHVRSIINQCTVHNCLSPQLMVGVATK